jgi:hypothetical protein
VCFNGLVVGRSNILIVLRTGDVTVTSSDIAMTIKTNYRVRKK